MLDPLGSIEGGGKAARKESGKARRRREGEAAEIGRGGAVSESIALIGKAQVHHTIIHTSHTQGSLHSGVACGAYGLMFLVSWFISCGVRSCTRPERGDGPLL